MQNLCMCDDGESPIVLLLVLASRLQLSRTQLQKVLFNLHVEAPEVLDLLLDFLHGEVLFGKGFEFHFLKLGVVLVRDVDDLGYLPFHIRSLAHGALEVDDLQHWALADIGEQLAPVLLDHLVKLIDARLLHTVAGRSHQTSASKHLGTATPEWQRWKAPEDLPSSTPKRRTQKNEEELLSHNRSVLLAETNTGLGMFLAAKPAKEAPTKWVKAGRLQNDSEDLCTLARK
eukprot:s3065_g8.t1